MDFANATDNEFDIVYAMMLRAKERLFEEHVYQWDERYPKKEMILNDLKNGYTTLVKENDNIVAFFTSNSICEDDVHDNVKWSYNGDNWVILHRLCIDPLYQNKGLGQKILEKFEAEKKIEKFDSIRIDVFSTNDKAIHIYEKFCYKRVGEAECERGLFYIYDKILQKYFAKIKGTTLGMFSLN